MNTDACRPGRRCLDLQKLIDVKRAAGRPKDFEAIGELELLRDKRRRPQP